MAALKVNVKATELEPVKTLIKNMANTFKLVEQKQISKFDAYKLLKVDFDIFKMDIEKQEDKENEELNAWQASKQIRGYINKGELQFAIRKALNNFDAWNDVTGCFPKGVSYYYEMQAVIEDAVRIGAKIAVLGMGADLSDILDKQNRRTKRMGKYINEERLKADFGKMTESELDAKGNELIGRVVIGSAKLNENASYKDLVEFADAIAQLAGIAFISE